MLLPSKGGGKEYYLSDADNINEGKFITTDQNDAVKRAEGNLTFWRVSGKDVHYSDQSIGKTVRVNINAGGGLAKINRTHGRIIPNIYGQTRILKMQNLLII